MKPRPIVNVLIVLSLLLAAVAQAQSKSGATLTPDGLSYMVSKDIGADRWTINLNLSSDFPPRFLNASGNIFRADGGPPSFVLCQLRPDSEGSLADPNSTFRFTCTGSGACQGTARGCSQNEWQEIPNGGDVRVSAGFFLPPGGNGEAPSAVLDAARSAIGTGRTYADASSRGSTLSSDGFNFLVNKDVGVERWSISLNRIPIKTSDGSVETIVNSVTGNVFKPGGSPPSFLYCTIRPDSSGTLDDPASEFRLSCLGTDACSTTASECAWTAWQPIDDDIVLEAGFFLPPGGLPALNFSDPEIVIIGRTSDPPSIVSPEFHLVGGSSRSLGRASGASCPVDSACTVPRIGGCVDVPGTVVSVGFCGCKITDVANTCITCGSGASGTCGRDCAFPVGTRGLEARGLCLPYASDSGDCACFAIPAGGDLTVSGCGGTVAGTCPSGACCADDPRDGCEATSGGLSCAGVCVSSGGCDPSTSACGICEPPPTPTTSPTPTTPPDTPTPCGNGSIDPGEECDGSALGGQSCATRGFCGGQLSCTPECELDDQGCTAGGLPNGATCPAGDCCASGVCAATIDDPGDRRCITCPKLNEECSDAACCDPFGQLECQPAGGSSFCCVGSQFACEEDRECCSGQCQGGVCQ